MVGRIDDFIFRLSISFLIKRLAQLRRHMGIKARWETTLFNKFFLFKIVELLIRSFIESLELSLTGISIHFKELQALDDQRRNFQQIIKLTEGWGPAIEIHIQIAIFNPRCRFQHEDQIADIGLLCVFKESISTAATTFIREITYQIRSQTCSCICLCIKDINTISVFLSRINQPDHLFRKSGSLDNIHRIMNQIT